MTTFFKNHETGIKVVCANLFLIIIFSILVFPAALAGKDPEPWTAQVWDHYNYQLPWIDYFVANPPSFGKPYVSMSAMTPGHPIFLSWVSILFADGQVGSDVLPIRLVNELLGLACLLVIWWVIFLNSNGGIIRSTILTMPILFSHYFLGSSIWINTENVALLWAVIVLFFLLRPVKTRNLITASFFTILAILWRHSYLWLLLPMFIKSIELYKHKQKSLIPILTLIGPLLVMGYFISIWGGMTPPEFAWMLGPNLAVPVYTVSLLACFSLFFIGFLWADFKHLFINRNVWGLIVAIISGLVLAVVLPTNYDGSSGRWGGPLWTLVKVMPTIYDRSVLFLVLCPARDGFEYLSKSLRLFEYIRQQSRKFQ